MIKRKICSVKGCTNERNHPDSYCIDCRRKINADYRAKQKKLNPVYKKPKIKYCTNCGIKFETTIKTRFCDTCRSTLTKNQKRSGLKNNPQKLDEWAIWYEKTKPKLTRQQMAKKGLIYVSK